MPDGAVQRELGALDARMEQLELEMRAARAELKAISETIAGARGGWKTLAVLLSALGVGGGGFALWIINHLPAWAK